MLYCKLHRVQLVTLGALSSLAAFWVPPAFAAPASAASIRAVSDAPAGTLVSKSQVAHAPAGATAWRIRYRSIAENGTSVEISGIVFIPGKPAPQTGRDIVAWAHGTVGIAETCQPSTNPQIFENVPDLVAMLDAGYVVTATDFQGLGTPGPHPYLVGVSTARAVIDSVRAARALPDTVAGSRYVVWGESQGAHAALWAAHIARSYAPELDLIGVAAAAPPTDLVANYKAPTSRLAHALITSLTTASWSRIYHIPLSTFANPFGRYVIRKLARDCLHREPTSAFTSTVLLLLSNQIPYELSQEWQQKLQKNSAPIEAYPVPLLLVQDVDDDVVPNSLTRRFMHDVCERGTIVKYLPVEGGAHTEVATRSVDATLRWITDRFAGRAPPNDCGAESARAP